MAEQAEENAPPRFYLQWQKELDAGQRVVAMHDGAKNLLWVDERKGALMFSRIAHLQLQRGARTYRFAAGEHVSPLRISREPDANDDHLVVDERGCSLAQGDDGFAIGCDFSLDSWGFGSDSRKSAVANLDGNTILVSYNGAGGSLHMQNLACAEAAIPEAPQVRGFVTQRLRLAPLHDGTPRVAAFMGSRFYLVSRTDGAESAPELPPVDADDPFLAVASAGRFVFACTPQTWWAFDLRARQWTDLGEAGGPVKPWLVSALEGAPCERLYVATHTAMLCFSLRNEKDRRKTLL